MSEAFKKIIKNRLLFLLALNNEQWTSSAMFTTFLNMFAASEFHCDHTEDRQEPEGEGLINPF